MAIGSLADIVPRLRSVVASHHGAGDDAELLEEFVLRRDELAFEAMVRRHGPMVFAVCRRVLRHTHDAEDAFQATFLVLAHKAASVSPRNKLAGWLHGVAYKTALKARQRTSRRVEIEKRVPARDPEAMHPETNWDEVEPLLDQELGSLPDHYRMPIILCDLEGRPRAQAASTLGCSEGTLSSRLTRGRRMLADRLKRRGVHLSVGAVAALLSERSVALAEPLIRATLPVALSAVDPTTVGNAASTSVATLAAGVMKSMFLQKLQTVAMVAFVAALTLTGVATIPTLAAPVPKTAPVPGADEKAVLESLADVDSQLLMNRKVLKDVKVDFDQFDKIMDTLEAAQKKASEATNQAMMGIKVNAAGGGPVNIEAFQQMMQDAQDAGEKELRKSVAAVVKDTLTPAQRSRLRQIDLQVRGHEAFNTASVAKALELTEKQKDQFKTNAEKVADDIQQAFNKPIAGNFAIGGAAGPNGVVVGFGGGTDFEKVTRDARAEGMKRALEILTDNQKGTWKALTGEPFTHPIFNHKWMQFGGNGKIRVGGAAGFAPAVPPVMLPAKVLPIPAGIPGNAVPVVPPPVVKPGM
jgi:RNA polymerase sigma factor (sigma-70 family)